MATSGTTAFTLDLTDIIEEAYARCGVEARSGWEFRTARTSLNLMFADWASRGVNLWTVDSGTLTMVAGTATYVLPADTIDVFEAVVRTDAGVTATQADISLSRISTPEYANIPNKLSQGRPLQMWVQRLATPQVTLWPVPDSADYTVVYWRLRRIQDASTGPNTMDVPFRFLPTMVAGLAYYLAMKVPNGLERVDILKAQYDQAWEMAAAEDRDRAPVKFVPRIM
jgi:hypothetical protein